MMRSKLLNLGAAALASIGFLALPAMAATEGWVTDLDAAKKLAAEKKLDIFVNFTGSDW